MSNINNDAQLEKLILNELRKALVNIANEVFEGLWKNINKNIYNQPKSEYYDRTNQFFNSLIKPNVKVSKGEVSVDIGMDSNKIDSILADNKNKFNHHMSINGESIWNGIPISEALLTWWDLGTNNSPYANLNSTNYWTDVFGDSAYGKENPDYKNIKKIIDREIKNALSKFGIINKTGNDILSFS